MDFVSDLLSRVAKAAHPVDLGFAVLALAASCRRPAFWRAPATRLMLCAAAVDAGVRSVTLLSGIPYQTRYLAPLTLAVCVLAGEGLLVAARMARRLPDPSAARFPRMAALALRLRNGAVALAVLAAILFLFNAGKAALPRLSSNPEVALFHVARERTPPGQETALVSMLDDPRPAFYAEAVEYLLKPGADALAEAVAISDYSGLPEGFSCVARILPEPANLSCVTLRWKGGTPSRMTIDLLVARAPPVPSGVEAEGREEKALVPVAIRGTDVVVLDQSVPTHGWLRVYDGPGVAESSFSRRRCVGVRVAWAGERCVPVRVEGWSAPPWSIFVRGRGRKAERLVDAGLPSGLANLGAVLERLGPLRAFLLVDRGDAEFRALFAAAAIPFPFERVASGRDDKGKPLVLYRFAPVSGAASAAPAEHPDIRRAGVPAGVR